ncbi:MAG: hypothetical protein RLZZ44_319 [Bacteroidota bacterium]|jgi:hypothetical protein
MKNNLATLLNQLEHHIPDCEITNFQVSQSNVGWQIEHSLLTINGIVQALLNANPNDYVVQFNVMKWFFLLTRKFPRGKAKAPKVVVPKVEANRIDLQKHIDKTRETIKGLELISKNHFFKHPYFGNLNKKQSIWFLEIHTHHHLKIIHDIVSYN